MRSNQILDLKYMVIRTVENELSLDEHMALYEKLIKFTDSPILRRADDRFLCDIGLDVIINGIKTEIIDFNKYENRVTFKKTPYIEYEVDNLRLLGFTLDNEPILEYNT